ncbi:response regulator transcription factor [Solirubrobacter ginsenosidimutans]|uniref:Response regulator transcription factor n=1 Tax=Solirubrobacter ginsenosidimutans TaxID=490573 RepID=A0A9X3MZC7_9ACTN|nr:response regulator transcription factor [Solirubrobacter ginsenosidimutans]MDA0165639.1 response regulator transcription factor [Solirubrobacter ginsenosidimutans]
MSVPNTALRGSVLLVDNQDLIHIGLRVVLQRQDWVTRIIGARRGEDAVLLAARHEPRVALVDLFVGEEFGAEICAAIRSEAPTVRVLLTSSARSITQHAARVAGACGFVPKDSTAAELVDTLRAVAGGDDPFVWRPEVRRGQLSERQRQILDLMAEGETNRTIAEALGLSVDTVKHHTTLIYRKLDVRNRAAAVHRGQRLGLVQPAIRVPQRHTEAAATPRELQRAA